MISRISLKLSSFFRINEEGKDVFYPWAYPGEALYVDQKKKKQALSLLRFTVAFFILSFLGIVFARFGNVINPVAFTFLLAALGVVIPFLYIGGIYFLKKNTDFYILPKAERPFKGNFFDSWLLIIVYEALAAMKAISLILISHSLSADELAEVWVPIPICIASIALSIFGIISLSYLYLKIRWTRGYLFSF